MLVGVVSCLTVEVDSSTVRNEAHHHGAANMTATNTICLIATIVALVARFATAKNIQAAATILRTAFAV